MLSEFDESKVVFAVLFEAAGGGAEVFAFAEEAFDEVAVAIEEGAIIPYEIYFTI